MDQRFMGSNWPKVIDFKAIKIHNTLPFGGEDKPLFLYKILQHVKDPCRV
jgi:hypothetical protein